MGAGPAALQAVATIQRLELFPAVFQAPAPMAALLGDGYGAPCLAVMTAAAELMGDLGGWAGSPVGPRNGHLHALSPRQGGVTGMPLCSRGQPDAKRHIRSGFSKNLRLEHVQGPVK